MRTVTKNITVYSVDDVLGMPELKEVILEKYRDFNVTFDNWHDPIIEDWLETLENYGFISPEINYSGFCSQGDGASFTCGRVDLPLFLEKFGEEIGFTDKQKKLLLALMEDYVVFAFYVKRGSSRYYHEHTVFVASDDHLYCFNGYNRLQSFLTSAMETLENVIGEKVVEFSRKIYRELEQEYEYLTSEEAIFENLAANEYEFTEDGETFWG